MTKADFIFYKQTSSNWHIIDFFSPNNYISKEYLKLYYQLKICIQERSYKSYRKILTTYIIVSILSRQYLLEQKEGTNVSSLTNKNQIPVMNYKVADLTNKYRWRHRGVL